MGDHHDQTGINQSRHLPHQNPRRTDIKIDKTHPIDQMRQRTKSINIYIDINQVPE
jgi:hypothetical protein